MINHGENESCSDEEENNHIGCALSRKITPWE